MSNWKSKAIWIIAILVIGYGLYQAMQTSPIPVDSATIDEGPLLITANEEGVTRIREIYRVSSPVAGLILRSPREIGDTVEKDKTLIATIRPMDPSLLDKRTRTAAQAAVQAADAAVRLAKAQLNRAKAELEYAHVELTRTRNLTRRQTIPRKHLEQAELQVKTRSALLETAKAELEVRKQELERAKAQLIGPRASQTPGEGSCCIEVKAPVSGRVLKILTESETVAPSGAAILEIGDPSDLEISVDLLSSDAVRITQGAEVTIDNWGGDQTLKGRIRRIEPSGFMKVSALGIEEQRVKARINITTPKKYWKRLGHDYRVFVRITVWKKEKVLRVPVSALFRKGNDWAVFKISNGVAKIQTLTIDKRNDQFAMVVKGLSNNDSVVLHPGERLENGTPVVDRKTLR